MPSAAYHIVGRIRVETGAPLAAGNATANRDTLGQVLLGLVPGERQTTVSKRSTIPPPRPANVSIAADLAQLRADLEAELENFGSAS